MKQQLKFIIAGGKTGGHLFPGIAIAQAISRLESQSSILFVGTGDSFETRTVARYGFQHRRIVSSGIKGKGMAEKLKALFQIPLSILQAVMIIKKFRPDMVVGVGGYASGPVLLGARLCGTKTAIHEQNSIAGVTNKILSRFVHIIFTSFKKTKGLNHSQTMIHTGNPVRKELCFNPSEMHTAKHCEIEPAKPDKTEPERAKTFTILVTGGSQGAKSINTAFLEAVRQTNVRQTNVRQINVRQINVRQINVRQTNVRQTNVRQTKPPENTRYRIIHQTGSLDEDRVIKAYEHMKTDTSIDHNTIKHNIIKHNSNNNIADSINGNANITGNITGNITAKAFFDDMNQLMARADLVICRAGAGTISELTALGIPALLVPYPHAADDHQTFNAKALVDQGAAWMIRDDALTGQEFLKKITFAAEHPDFMKNMADRALKLGTPHADEAVAAVCISVAKGK